MRLHNWKKMSSKGILTSCNKAQQLISCLTSTCDGQGKLDAYGVQQRKRKACLVCLRVQLEMMTRDRSTLKNGTKIRKSLLGGMTESEPVNQKRERWCHRNENEAWWCHQGYKKGLSPCFSSFPHQQSRRQHLQERIHVTWHLQINTLPYFHTDGAQMELMSCQLIVMKIITKC